MVVPLNADHSQGFAAMGKLNLANTSRDTAAGSNSLSWVLRQKCARTIDVKKIAASQWQHSFCSHPSAWAQDNTYDISLGGAAVFSKQSTGNGTVLTPTNSGAVLVTGRYRFSEHNSVEINYSHTANSQVYFASPLTYRIQGTIGEYSGAYVFSFHRERKTRTLRLCGRGRFGLLSGLQLQHHQWRANLSSGVPANQASVPVWRRGRLPHLLDGAPGSPVFADQSPGPPAAIPGAGLQGARFQSAEPVYRRQRTHGRAFGRGL